jgi:predicted CoA-binding protein
VQIVDSGPGIPEAIRDKVFDPFFTTKPPGQGTGLGLDISYNIVVNRHRGEISVTSRPGRTAFTVLLPVSQAAAAAPLGNPARPPDAILRRILESTRIIAVVGASTKPDVPGHRIPLELQARGYRVIPVNPNAEQLFGEKAYPDLEAVPETPDVVLLFRRDGIAEVVEAAIRKHVPVVWMQEGIVDDAAAARAREAGLEVVMDTCMSMTYKRVVEKRP